MPKETEPALVAAQGVRNVTEYVTCLIMSDTDCGMTTVRRLDNLDFDHHYGRLESH